MHAKHARMAHTHQTRARRPRERGQSVAAAAASSTPRGVADIALRGARAHTCVAYGGVSLPQVLNASAHARSPDAFCHCARDAGARTHARDARAYDTREQARRRACTIQIAEVCRNWQRVKQTVSTYATQCKHLKTKIYTPHSQSFV